MPVREELEKLRESVRTANGPDREIDAAIGAALSIEAKRISTTTGHADVWLPYSSSIDAALALVERVLPGWNYQLMRQRGDHAPFYLARLAKTVDDEVTGFDAVNDHSQPLAIVDALLTALLANPED